MYTFKNTEINNKKASDYETKSLLYLMGMRPDSDEIDVFTVDCFNDVTGASSDFSKMWDVQSKNHKTLGPAKIGESLITLYNNYISNFNFTEYILFIHNIKSDYLHNDQVSIYKYDNFLPKIMKGIECKLIEKINGSDDKSTPPLFVDFLSRLTFVEGSNNDNASYIKSISNFKNKKIISDDLYESIFKEVRNIQTSLKNSEIENEVISEAIEVLNFKRHITKQEINTLLISRLMGAEVFHSNSIPLYYLPVMKHIDDPEDISDNIQNCQSNLSRALFDKNSSLEFWTISEFIITAYKENPSADIFNVHQALISKVKINAVYIDQNTILFMAALVRGGIKRNAD